MGQPVEVRVLSRALTLAPKDLRYGTKQLLDPSRSQPLFASFPSRCPARLHQLRESLSTGCCKCASLPSRGLFRSSCFPSCRPASFHQQRKLPSPRGRQLTFSPGRSCFSSASSPCPASSSGCRKLRSCGRREVASGVGGSGWPLRCTSQKRRKASLQIIDLLAN